MNRLENTTNTINKLLTCPTPTLGLDIDGVVDEAPIFFRTLSHCWPGEVYIVSFRSDRAKAIEFLKSKNIRYDKLFLVSSLEDKARVIVEEGIMIFFDDQPECLKDMPSNRNIMLVRNEGNFDFDEKKWLMSDITGKII